ncbi:MAG: hypothetical protein E7065_02675 [Lentimicrobiaceae bacterium]|nr:hypothetical protein [Lentimicrobiaceae bacterium]
MKNLNITKQVLLLLLIIIGGDSLKAFLKKSLLSVLMCATFIVIFSSCTKKSGCADANGYYDTGYFTYFDDKITIDTDGFHAHDVNAVFIPDNCYPTCSIGVVKKTVPMKFRNNGEEIRVAVSVESKHSDGIPESPYYLYLHCIEKID